MAFQTVTVQPAAIQTPSNAKTSMWSTQLCDCCEDMGICCFGFWCHCCLMCQTSQEFGECLCLPLIEMCFIGLVPSVSYALRTGIRERYHIQGSMCDDCCAVTCCRMCAWCQMARELKYRRRSPVLVNPVSVSVQVPQIPQIQHIPHATPSYNPPYNPGQPHPMGHYPKPY